MVCGPGKTEPVRLTPAGLRIVRSARSVMSNPLKPSEFWMNTETWSWVPWFPVRDAGLDGHEVVPGVTRQTVPVNCA